MAEYELKQELAVLETSLGAVEAVLQPSQMAAEIDELEKQASNPDLWNDQALAQQVTGQLSRLKARLASLANLRQQLDDLGVLLDLAGEEDSSSALKEVESEILGLKAKIDNLEVETLLNGEFDSRGAVVTIRSGAGGDDACDFAESLMKMYLKWAFKNGFEYDILSQVDGDVAGISSAVLEMFDSILLSQVNEVANANNSGLMPDFIQCHIFNVRFLLSDPLITDLFYDRCFNVRVLLSYL